MDSNPFRLRMLRYHAAEIGIITDNSVTYEALLPQWLKARIDSEDRTVPRSSGPAPVSLNSLYSVGISGSQPTRGFGTSTASPLISIFANRNHSAEVVEEETLIEFTQSFSEDRPTSGMWMIKSILPLLFQLFANPTPSIEGEDTEFEFSLEASGTSFSQSFSEHYPAPSKLGVESASNSATLTIFANANLSSESADTPEFPVEASGISFNQSFSEHYPAPYNLSVPSDSSLATPTTFANPNFSSESAREELPIEAFGISVNQSFSEHYPALHNLGVQPSNPLTIFANPDFSSESSDAEFPIEASGISYNQPFSEHYPAPYNLGVDSSSASSTIFAGPNYSSESADEEVPIAASGISVNQSFSEHYPAPYILSTEPESGSAASQIFADPNHSSVSAETEFPIEASGISYNQSFSENYPAPYDLSTSSDSGPSSSHIFANPNFSAERGEEETPTAFTQSFSENWPAPDALGSCSDFWSPSEVLANANPSVDSENISFSFTQSDFRSLPGSPTNSEYSTEEDSVPLPGLLVPDFESAFELPLPHETMNPYSSILRG